MTSRRHSRVLSKSLALALVLCLLLVSCGQTLPSGTAAPSGDAASDGAGATGGDSSQTRAPSDPGEASAAGAATPTAVPTTADGRVSVVVDIASENGVPIDRRLLGTNLPAWLGAERLGDAEFQQRSVESGTTLLRMPGGSWSNGYDWLGCEQGDPDTCFRTWAARPTDFIDFMQATELPGMWTVSINETAQQSAAAVAFFNGDIDDTTQIGVDRLGVDWGQVGDWAQLRAANGNPEPVEMTLWEVGNEVYGGRPDSGGALCAEWGWETVWTCDGTEYTQGNDDNDGALAHRAAMLAVDPTIEVGLVGVSDPDSWSQWGTKVITAADDALDLYIVHHYSFNQSPDADQALTAAGLDWPGVIASSRRGLPEGAKIAITELNLVALESGDTSQTMTRAMNAFYLADTLGELAVAEVAIANWWNLANGVTESGTDYGLISVEDDRYERTPTFHAFAMWGRTGTTLLPTIRTDNLRVYPTQHANGDLTILAINLSSDEIATSLTVDGLDPSANYSTTVEALISDDLESQQLTLTSPSELTTPLEPISLDLAAQSIALIEVRSTS